MHTYEQDTWNTQYNIILISSIWYECVKIKSFRMNFTTAVNIIMLQSTLFFHVSSSSRGQNDRSNYVKS